MPNSELDAHIGRFIARTRLELGLSLTSLALAAGVTPFELDQWEMGRERCRADKLVRIAAFFDVPVVRFFEDAA